MCRNKIKDKFVRTEVGSNEVYSWKNLKPTILEAAREVTPALKITGIIRNVQNNKQK